VRTIEKRAGDDRGLVEIKGSYPARRPCYRRSSPLTDSLERASEDFIIYCRWTSYVSQPVPGPCASFKSISQRSRRVSRHKMSGLDLLVTQRSVRSLVLTVLDDSVWSNDYIRAYSTTFSYSSCRVLHKHNKRCQTKKIIIFNN